ncbi:MAG: acyltransferase [Planctomycetia bacterium]
MITLQDPDVLRPRAGRTATSPAVELPDDAAPFLHPAALVEGAEVGAGTRVWAFAHLLAGAVVGRDCNICDHVFIEDDVRVGDRVTIKCGVYLWAGTRIDDDVFLGPGVVFTNDRQPRSRRRPVRFDGVTVRRGASVGAGAVLLPGVEIGEYAMIGAGAVVTRSVPAYALVYGNPARHAGWVCRCGKKLGDREHPPFCRSCAATAEAEPAAEGQAA